MICEPQKKDTNRSTTKYLRREKRFLYLSVRGTGKGKPGHHISLHFPNCHALAQGVCSGLQIAQLCFWFALCKINGAKKM